MEALSIEGLADMVMGDVGVWVRWEGSDLVLLERRF